MLWLVSLIQTFLFQMNELNGSEECDGQITNTHRMRITAQDLQKNNTTKSNTEPERYTHCKIQHRRFMGWFCWFYKHTHTHVIFVSTELEWAELGQRSRSSHWCGHLIISECLWPYGNTSLHHTIQPTLRKWLNTEELTKMNSFEACWDWTKHFWEIRPLYWAQRLTFSVSTTLTQKHTPVLDEEEITHQMSFVSQLSLLKSNESKWRSNRDFSWILTISLLRKTPIISHVSLIFIFFFILGEKSEIM